MGPRKRVAGLLLLAVAFCACHSGSGDEAAPPTRGTEPPTQVPETQLPPPPSQGFDGQEGHDFCPDFEEIGELLGSIRSGTLTAADAEDRLEQLQQEIAAEPEFAGGGSPGDELRALVNALAALGTTSGAAIADAAPQALGRQTRVAARKTAAGTRALQCPG